MGAEEVRMPALEMYEKPDYLVVGVELPGVREEDVGISLTGQLLTIKGERKASADVKDEEYLHCEVCYGPLSRAVSPSS